MEKGIKGKDLHGKTWKQLQDIGDLGMSWMSACILMEVETTEVEEQNKFKKPLHATNPSLWHVFKTKYLGGRGHLLVNLRVKNV